MNDNMDDMIEQLRRREMERPRQPLPPPERPTVHYTELREASPDSPLAQELNYYRREVSRLLAEGHEGKWILIKDEEIIGIWPERRNALQTAAERFLLQPVLIRQVLTREPVIRVLSSFRTKWRS